MIDKILDSILCNIEASISINMRISDLGMFVNCADVPAQVGMDVIWEVEARVERTVFAAILDEIVVPERGAVHGKVEKAAA